MLWIVACTPPDAPPPPPPPTTTTTTTEDTSPPPPDPVEVEVVIEDLPLSVHGKRLAVTLSRAVTPTLTCTSPDDPGEEHVVVGTEALEQSLEVHGLLAATRYTCAVVAADGTWEGELTTGAGDPRVPGLAVVVDRGDSDGAYTVFNHWLNGGSQLDRVVVVDREGRVRFAWTLDAGTLSDVDVSWVPEQQAFLVGGGSGYAPRFVLLDGTTTWVAPGPQGSGWYHHHTEVLADGTVLSLATELDEWEGFSYEGAQIEVRDPVTDTVRWEWHGADALLAGALPAPIADGAEPWHANAVVFADDDDGPAALVSFKWLDRLARIDRTTGAVTWQLGPGADFALVDAAGIPLPDAEWFYGQHDPKWDPGTGRVLLYDNGSGRPDVGPPYSRVLELAIDPLLRTATPVWSWTEPGWYEPLYGGVDRLPGGHVLVAMGHCACVPGALDHRSAVVEIDPTDDEVVWRLELDDPLDGLYRAARVDGCALFANRRYCP